MTVRGLIMSGMASTVGRVLIVGLAVAAIAFAVGRFLVAALGADMPSFDAGYIATIAGIIVGVPVALGIAGAQETGRRASQASARASRAADLLRRLDADLAETLQELESQDRQPRVGSIVPFLGTGLWDVLKSTGDLALLSDLGVMRDVSRAYDRIGLTAYLERQAWELTNSPDLVKGISPGVAGYVVDTALAQIRVQDEHTRAAIHVARQKIAEGLISASA